MHTLSPDFIEKAKSAETPEQLQQMAAVEGISPAEQEARQYFDQLIPPAVS